MSTPPPPSQPPSGGFGAPQDPPPGGFGAPVPPPGPAAPQSGPPQQPPSAQPAYGYPQTGPGYGYPQQPGTPPPFGPVPSPRGIAAAFAAGASGYVRQDERIEGVERALAKARAGEVAIAPQLLQGAFAELLNPAAQPDDEGSRLLRLLTPREVEVLVRVAEGEDTRLIAAGMEIAPSTARTHVQRVLMKLGVGSRLEAAALAARTGLLDRALPPAPPAAAHG
ncbi:response regulator transcription factor [Streptomyces avidinii]